ncbi:hypothetical protein AVEN_132292-1 [Araneus ventricosus]|uniref:Uncharacterized protein n=1 Tax=Araneus ventricosus TaxID=182803 RepID=A0A4Y2KN49_ARAVE|nr:hypothetical protein AVEN_132292-1 [Araneus ventricosus]
MWAPLRVDEWLRFVYEGTRPPRVTLQPPSVIVRASYGRGWAVRLCWPLGPDLSTRFYCNDCHSVKTRVLCQVGGCIYGIPLRDPTGGHREFTDEKLPYK